MKDQTAFSTRFARHKDELEWLFMELYHNREGLEVLEREMADAYNARSAELKALDKARSADPDWYKRGNMFGMTMYTDLFAGNLKELAKKLPYLKEQKLTYLHLMPLLQMPHPHNDGGYAVEDFDTVDPALGTNKDLENLTRELRKAGISLCLDFVMNHTASTHRWAMAAKAGDPWFQAYYHLYDDRTIPDQYEQTVPQVFPNTAPGNFTWCEEMHKWVLTTFHDYQWDLNYANPAVFVDMTKSILHLANLGVEVFRIDAVPYIWKQLGTTCRNLPQVHTIVRMLRMVLECVCPAVILKGEVVMAPKELAAYFGTPEKPECHMLYNVSTMVNLWGALASRDTRLLKAQLDALHALPKNCWFVNYLRCHDDIGWGLDEAVENAYFTAWQFAAEDGSEALLNLVVTHPQANPLPIHLCFRGLEEDAVYELDGIDYFGSRYAHDVEDGIHKGMRFSGSTLLYAGLVLPQLFGDYPSVQLHLTRKG